MGCASLSAWTLGYADSAHGRIAQAIAFAGDSKNYYDLAVARFFESWLFYMLRAPQHAEVAATQAVAISEEHGLPYPRRLARTTLGWAQAQLGRAGEGVSLIRLGLAGLAETGARWGITDQLTRLAEAQALDGKIDDALVTIEEALTANPEELVFQPNALTCSGELRLKLAQTALAEPGGLGPSVLAEADFREAIALAQKMTAKAWELRATTSLARLLRDTGRRDEARTLLSEIYNWFTEGFDTADLIDAKALLDALSV
jgi:tetratricopeptide (TPR) repeat protein